MTKQEFAIFLDNMRNAYPREKVLPTEGAKALWFNALSDIPNDVASAALAKHMFTSTWPPSIAEIRKLASEVVMKQPAEWSEAWKKVRKAVRNFGTYGEEDAMASFDPVTREVVRRMGYQDLCMMPSDEVRIYEAHFRDIYEQIVREHQEVAAMPQDLSNRIEQIRNDALMLEQKSEI